MRAAIVDAALIVQGYDVVADALVLVLIIIEILHALTLVTRCCLIISVTGLYAHLAV